MSLITKLFGTYSQHQLKKVNVIADRVDALADTYAAMSNDELRGMTEKLKARYAAGKRSTSFCPTRLRRCGKRMTAFSESARSVCRSWAASSCIRAELPK